MATAPSFGGRIAKSRGEVKQQKDELYKTSFGDLPDGTIYRDVWGWKADDGVTLQKNRWQQMRDTPVFEDGSSIVDKWDELQKNGYSIEETHRIIKDATDTGSWRLPIDIIPEVFVVNPEQLPMADMMTRVTTQDDEVVATPLEEFPDIEFGLEDPDVTRSDGDAQYEFDTPDYGELNFDVLGMGAATRISDKMILSSANLRNAESTVEQAFVRAMAQKLERQIIFGTDTDNSADGDADGFDGFNDFIDDGDGEVVANLGDPTDVDPEDIEDTTRELIDDSEFEGAAREDLAVVMDFESHRLLRESITDKVRYNDPAAEIDAGFEALTYDGVPVFKSTVIPRLSELESETQNQIYTVNMNATYLSVLQETTVRPLARLGPEERMGVDMYGTLVTEENGQHIRAADATAT